MVLIHMYAIIIINIFLLKKKKNIYILRFWYYFSIMAVFHVKIETMPLKYIFWSQISAIWLE